MVHLVVSASKVLFFMAALYGWGSLVNRWSYGTRVTGWAYPSALGIASLIAMGGVLNAVHLAKGPVLLALLAIGLGLALFFVSSAILARKQKGQPIFPLPARLDWNAIGSLVYRALMLLVFCFLVLTLVPSRSFNFHDDFHIYLLWPVKMLETGSLGGNPFTHIGLSALGGQSFMQGVFQSISSIAEINGFDAVACFILILGILKELGERLKVHSLFILLAGITAIGINPHYVNVTSLYSGTLLLLGLTYATLLLTDSLTSEDPATTIHSAAPCAIFLAAFLALKTTYIFTAPLYWAASLAGSLILLKEKKTVLISYVTIALGSIALLIPWLAVHSDRYLRKIQYIMEGIHYPGGGEFSAVKSIENSRKVLEQLLSTETTFYGNTFRDYLLLVILLCLAWAAAGWTAWRGRHAENNRTLIPIMALLTSVVITYPCYYKLTYFPARLVLRYPLPLLIGAAAATALLAGWLWQDGFRKRQEKSAVLKTPLVLACLLLTFQIGVMWLFRETFVERVRRAANYGTLISFPLAYNSNYMAYNEYALSDSARMRMAAIQNLVPAGVPILDWVALPMYFDYRRNPIFATSEHGLSNKLLVMPLAEGPEAIRRFLQEEGIRYVVWEYQGYGMKAASQQGNLQIKFMQCLAAMMLTSKTLYNDGEIVVFDIGLASK